MKKSNLPKLYLATNPVLIQMNLNFEMIVKLKLNCEKRIAKSQF